MTAIESVEYEGNMEEQGGGHGRIRKCRAQPGNIACISKPLDHCEGNAYKALQNTPLKGYIPEFYGVHPDGDGKECIIISDLTAGFDSPCLADFKVGKRHYDINASQEKKDGLIAKQKGTTTDSLGLRLIDAKIRKNKEVVKEWDRKQGLKFTYDDLQQVYNEFIPSCLREQMSKKLDDIYGAFDDTVNQNPGFRMYAASFLICYDGDKPSELRVILIDFAHTHISIDAEGADSGDESFDDGVLVGISSLMNFAGEAGEAGNAAPMAAKRGGLDIEMVQNDDEQHKSIKKCIVNPGNHKCFLRPNDPHESEAYTVISSTPLNDYVPKLYGIENNAAVVEDIAGEFSTPCMADFKVGKHSFDIDDTADKKANCKIKDEKCTTATLGVRLLMAIKAKDKKPVKVWKRKETNNMDEAKLKEMAQQFADVAEVRTAIVKELQKLRKAYIATTKQHKNFRMYNMSILVAYDGDNTKTPPRCAFSKLAHSHLDIVKEGYDAKNAENDDGVLDGMDNLIDLINGSSSKCCLLI